MKIDSQMFMQEKLLNTTQQNKENNFSTILDKVKDEKDDKKLMESCQEIEAVFIQSLLKQMRASVPENKFLPKGTATKIYEGMLDQEYSIQAAKSHDSLGLAEMLYEELRTKK